MCAAAVVASRPVPIGTGTASSGSNLPTSRAVIGPSASAASTAARPAEIQASGSVIPAPVSEVQRLRCCTRCRSTVAAACARRVVSGPATHSVRRIAWWRSSVRSS